MEFNRFDLEQLFNAALTPRSPEEIKQRQEAVRIENERRKEDLLSRGAVFAKAAIGKTMTVSPRPRVKMTGKIVEAWVAGVRTRSASMIVQYGLIIETSAGCRNRVVVEKLPR